MEADPQRVSQELQPGWERCQQQRWSLLAAHVRTNHVHLVVEAEDLRYVVDEQGDPMAVFEAMEG